MNVLYGPDISFNTNVLNAYNAQAEMLRADLYQAQNWNNFEPNRRIKAIQQVKENFQTSPQTNAMEQAEANTSDIDNKLSVLDQAGIQLKLKNLEEERKRALFAIMKKYDDVSEQSRILQKQNEMLGLGASVPTTETFVNPTAIQYIGNIIDDRHDMTKRMDNDIQTMNERILSAEREYFKTQHYIFILKAVMAFLAVAILFIILNKLNLINDKVTMITISIVFIAFAGILFLAMTKPARDSKKMSVKFSKDLEELEKDKKNMP